MIVDTPVGNLGAVLNEGNATLDKEKNDDTIPNHENHAKAIGWRLYAAVRRVRMNKVDLFDQKPVYEDFGGGIEYYAEEDASLTRAWV